MFIYESYSILSLNIYELFKMQQLKLELYDKYIIDFCHGKISAEVIAYIARQKINTNKHEI